MKEFSVFWWGIFLLEKLEIKKRSSLEERFTFIFFSPDKLHMEQLSQFPPQADSLSVTAKAYSPMVSTIIAFFFILHQKTFDKNFYADTD